METTSLHYDHYIMGDLICQDKIWKFLKLEYSENSEMVLIVNGGTQLTWLGKKGMGSVTTIGMNWK